MLPRYKEIAELFKKGLTIEAQEKIMELREAAMELEEENRTLKLTVKELNKKIAFQKKVIYQKPSYWVKETEENDGPFCQKCHDSTDKLIRLPGGNNDVWYCYECSSTYYGPNYVKPVVQRPSRTRSSGISRW